MSKEVEKVFNNDFWEMAEEAKRFKTFKNWPFNDESNIKCTAAKMAEAGFFHCPTKNLPDLVQCYVCFKELDGWEPDDDPWEEHASHTKDCLFVKLNKKEQDLRVEELYKLEAQRHINKVKQITAEKIEKFRQEALKLRSSIDDIV